MGRVIVPLYSSEGDFAPAVGGGPLATDDFNRANAVTLGSNWTTSKGVGEDFGIVGNQAVIQTSGARDGSYYSAVVAPNDQYSKATVVALPSAELAVCVRSITSGTTRNEYRAGCAPGEFGGGNTLSRIWKEINNVVTDLGTGATTLAAGQVWQLQVIGTDLVFKINGVTEVTALGAATELSSGQFAIFGQNTGTNLAVFDNWEGGAP